MPSVRAFAAERCHQLLTSATQSDFAAAPPAAALRAAATTLGEHGGLLPKQARARVRNRVRARARARARAMVRARARESKRSSVPAAGEISWKRDRYRL